MGRNGSTVQPATRRGGPTPDEPTVQDCMLLSAVKAASEDEKSPFENPVLQQYQQVRELLGSGFQGWRRPTQRCSPPHRVAESPSRSVTCTRQFGDAPSLD